MEKKNNDLISRADAIREYQEVCNGIKCGECPFLIKVNTEKGSHLITDCKLEAFLHNLPSASVEAEMSLPKWIPCSERLPKEKARVLTYDTMGDIVFGQYDKGRWYWEAEACADYWAKNDGVIAWMPLPKPYEGSESDE